VFSSRAADRLRDSHLPQGQSRQERQGKIEVVKRSSDE